MRSQEDQVIIDMVEKMKEMDMAALSIIKVSVDSLAAKERFDKQACSEVQKTG